MLKYNSAGVVFLKKIRLSRFTVIFRYFLTYYTLSVQQHVQHRSVAHLHTSKELMREYTWGMKLIKKKQGGK